MEITEVRQSKYISLTPSGDLDANSSIEMDEKLSGLIAEQQVHLHINCKDLNYISSAGLGVFISHLEDIKAAGGNIVFSNMSENVLDVFELLGLNQLVQIVTDEQAAASILSHE